MSKSLRKRSKKTFEKGIDKLSDWVHKKGYSIEFDYCVRDEFHPADKTITISLRQGPEKRLYSLMHECGHLILHHNEKLYAKKYPSSTKMAYYNSNHRLERSPKYKIDILSEEIDAWRKGQDLAKRLNFYIDEENYYSIMAICVYSYVKSLAKP